MNIKSFILFITLTFSASITAAPISDEGDPKITHQVIFEIEQGDKLLGNLTLGLFGTVVPKTVANFYKLSELEFKNTIFHRVIHDFIIQGGDFVNADGTGGHSIYGKESGSLPDENFDLKHDRAGRLSMANAGPNTGGSQFFITSKATHWLDGNHVVFGQLLDGFETFSLIESTETDENARPLERVIIAHIYCSSFEQSTETKEVADGLKEIEGDVSSSTAYGESSESDKEDVEDEDTTKGKEVENAESFDDEVDKQLDTGNDTDNTNDGEDASSRAHYALIPIVLFALIIAILMFKAKNKVLLAVRGPRYRRL